MLVFVKSYQAYTMDLLTLKEKQKYETIWEHVPAYRTDSPGELLVDHFFHSFADQLKAGESIIDFGCGTGRVAKRFLEKSLDTTLIDFCGNCLDPGVQLLITLLPEKIRFVQACLWDLSNEIAPADWIYCCDVLEHIPEDKVEIVLEAMASRNLLGGYFGIALQEDHFGKEVFKEPLHLCVRDKDWWAQKLRAHWEIKEESCDAEGCYYNCCLIKK